MSTTTLSSKSVKKNIWLSITGLFTSLLGTKIYYFILGFYILKETNSSLEFAISILIGSLPRILLSPIAGSIADRFPKKKLVVGFDLLSGLLMLACFAIYPLITNYILFFYISILLLSVVNTFFSVSMEASIPTIVNKDDLMKINSYRSIVTSTSAIIAPIIGGFLFKIIDIRIFILINGISFLFSAFTESFIVFKVKKVVKEANKKIIEDIIDGYNYVKTKSQLKTLIVIFVIVNFIFSGFNVLASVIFVNDLGLSSANFGTINSFFFIGMLASAMILSQKNQRDRFLVLF